VQASAAERTTGRYDGLIRVWMKQPVPKLGLLGVRPHVRRTRLTAMMLHEVADRLRRRGVREIATRTDVTNAASHAMAQRHGGISGRVSVEYVRHAAHPTSH
ncbi:MAG: GNAT family N-acetyltransferase, partial [Ornithinimicrobium sp.]